MKIIAYNRKQFDRILEETRNRGLKFKADWLAREIHIIGPEDF